MKKLRKLITFLGLAFFAVIICNIFPLRTEQARSSYLESWLWKYPVAVAQSLDSEQRQTLDKLADAAIARTKHRVLYRAEYVLIPYPGGDVPNDRGVCTDVLIRSYRAIGIDLQREVHEDMKQNFQRYPKIWGLKKPDTNIDHRRVPNLMTFFKRSGGQLRITDKSEDYLPGDVVAWDIGGGTTHIGIVASHLSDDGKRNQIVHNIGLGPKLEDRLFEWRIIGHFRYP